MGYDRIRDPAEDNRLPFLCSALEDVVSERVRQEKKWGEQNHPNGTGPGTLARFCERARDADEARELRVDRFREGRGTYAHIFWEEVRAWKRHGSRALGGAPGARTLLKAKHNGRLYLPDVPTLREARFRCRVAKELAQVVMLACCKLHAGGALIATRAELAELVGCSPRTVFNGVKELELAGWVLSLASFHQGGMGRDGRAYRYREGPRRYVPGPAMLLAWDANAAVVALPKGTRLDRCRRTAEARRKWLPNEGGNGCHPHRKDQEAERKAVLVVGGGVGEGLRPPPKVSGFAGRTTEGQEGGQQGAGQVPRSRALRLDEEEANCTTLEEVNALWAKRYASWSL